MHSCIPSIRGDVSDAQLYTIDWKWRQRCVTACRLSATVGFRKSEMTSVMRVAVDIENDVSDKWLPSIRHADYSWRNWWRLPAGCEPHITFACCNIHLPVRKSTLRAFTYEHAREYMCDILLPSTRTTGMTSHTHALCDVLSIPLFLWATHSLNLIVYCSM